MIKGKFMFQAAQAPTKERMWIEKRIEDCTKVEFRDYGI